MSFAFEPTGTGCRLTTVTSFGSVEELEQLVGMGMEQGMREAMAQIDAVLADLESFAAGRGTTTQVISDTQVRISRVIRGEVAQVWRAHCDPDLIRGWMLGPDGWSMPVCQVAHEVGDTYRYEWAPDEGTEGAGFGFEGELLESVPPNRQRFTERMIGLPGEAVVNELTLTAHDEGTLLVCLVTYPDVQTRDAVLATQMTDGMETSYARLEDVLARQT